MRKLALLVAILTIALQSIAQIRTRQPVAEKPVMRVKTIQGPLADSLYTADVIAMFDKMEQNIETLFTRLKKETKDEISKLNDMARQISGNVAALNKQLNKLQAELAKLHQLQSKFIAMMDSIKRTPGGGLLNGDRNKMQHRMDSLSTQRISVQDQINDLNGRIAMQAAANNEEKKNIQRQVTQLEQELSELEKQRTVFIAELRKEEQKVLAELSKMIKEMQMNAQQYQPVITAMVNSYADVLQENLLRVSSNQ